jgi:hypothetical protein
MTLFSSILYILRHGDGGLLGVIMYGLAFILAVIGLVLIFTHKENKVTRYAGILAGVAALIDLRAFVGVSSFSLEFGFWIILISAIVMAISDLSIYGR